MASLETKRVILATKKMIDFAIVVFTDQDTGKLDVNLCIDALLNTVQHISALSMKADVNRNELVKEWKDTLSKFLNNIVKDLNEDHLILERQRFIGISYAQVLQDMLQNDNSPSVTKH